MKKIVSFLNIKDCNLISYLNNCEVNKISIDKKLSLLNFYLTTPNYLTVDLIDIFFECSKNIKIEDLSVSLNLILLDNKLKENLYLEYLIYFLNKNFVEQFNYLNLESIRNSNIHVKDYDILVYINDKKILNRIFDLNLNKQLQYFFNKIGINKNIDFILECNRNDNIFLPKTKEIEKRINGNYLVENKNIKNKHNFNQKKITTIFDMISLSNMGRNFLIEAEVFNKEIRKLKDGKMLLLLKVTDYTESIIVKIWLNTINTSDLYLEKNWYRFYGLFQSGFINNQPEIICKEGIKITKEIKIDEEENKRIELHAHTKMSQLNGVIDVSDLISKAKELGHSAVAITDHSVVHSFPQAYFSSNRNKNIKVLYGCELNVYNFKDNKIFYEEIKLEKDKNINDFTYIVFDLETTGLSANNNKIIEIAAVKIVNEKMIDEYSCFINPKENISEFTKKLTNIKQEDLDIAKTIDEIMPDFFDWCGTDLKKIVFVAHNANFDIKFLKSTYKQLNNENIKINYMDTLQLSRCLFPKLKRHGLKYISKHLNILLNNHHRAIYDTKTTSEIFLKMLDKLFEKGVTKICDINKIITEEIKNNTAITRHTTVLAKNSIGLKNLYKIISKSHIEFFFKEARVPISLLNKYKEGILIGSACYKSELFDIFLNSSEEEFKETLNLYDYIEVQPPKNYSPLIEEGVFKDEDHLKESLKYFINMCISENKLVVATGNVHLLEKRDAIFRRIYIESLKGIHPLMRKGIKKIPLTNFLTTKEMIDNFSFLKDKSLINKIVVENTNFISNCIDNIDIIPNKLFTPKMENVENIVLEIVEFNKNKLYGSEVDILIKKRIEKELNSIINNGFAVIYYICHKIVNKSLKDGYVVGSRGSVGSSFIAYLMNITEVNPLPAHYICKKCFYCQFEESYGSGFDLPNKKCPNCNNIYLSKDGHNIPFETFLGFDGDKVPDIDLNFSGEYQYLAHNYTKDLFGEDKVYRAGTITTIANRTAFGYVKNYLEEHPEINLSSVEIDRIVDKISGVKKTTGRHAGGIIVVPDYMDIHDITPVQYPADGKTGKEWKTTHFDFVSIHDNLLKLDLLGHDDPTILRFLQDLTNIKPSEIPIDDPNIYSLFTSTKSLNFKKEIVTDLGSLGIPEFGTEFVRGMLKKTKPKSFSELVQISGLSHGTDVWINNAQDLVYKKICTLKDVIGCRDDIMIYLIQKGIQPNIAFEIMEMTRKGKFKNNNEYLELLNEKGIDKWYIESCQKIKYMFPKAHAVAYVLSAVRIAWFKIYKPLEFYAALFSVRYKNKAFDIKCITNGYKDIKSKLEELKNMEKKTAKDYDDISALELMLEMCARGYKFKTTDLYKSHETKFIIEDDSLIFPLQSIEGLGESVSNIIIKERKRKEFISKEDLQKRVPLTKTLLSKLEELKIISEMAEKNQLTLF